MEQGVADIRNDAPEAKTLASENEAPTVGPSADHIANRFQIRELSITDPTTTLNPDMTKDEKIELLEEALDRYQGVIIILQEQLSDREKEKLQAEEVIESLNAEIALLNEQRGERSSKTASENN